MFHVDLLGPQAPSVTESVFLSSSRRSAVSKGVRNTGLQLRQFLLTQAPLIGTHV